MGTICKKSGDTSGNFQERAKCAHSDLIQEGFGKVWFEEDLVEDDTRDKNIYNIGNVGRVDSLLMVSDGLIMGDGP